MTVLRVSLFAIFTMLGACGEVVLPPTNADDDAVSQSELEDGSAALASSLQSCIKFCDGDEGCIECCICTARGGTPQHCCI